MIFVGAEYSESGICIAMQNECTVIMACCQSIYVCSANFARATMVTIKNARAGFTIVQLFFKRFFLFFPAIFTKHLRL